MPVIDKIKKNKQKENNYSKENGIVSRKPGI